MGVLPPPLLSIHWPHRHLWLSPTTRCGHLISVLGGEHSFLLSLNADIRSISMLTWLQQAGTGTQLVVVLLGGSAMTQFQPAVTTAATADASDADSRGSTAAAVVWAGYGGEEAGNGLADVLTGVVAPSGKLPITFYTSIAQLPPFESYDMAGGRGRTFRYLQDEPLYYFGHGVSYTPFGYSNLVAMPLPALPAPHNTEVKLKEVGENAGESTDDGSPLGNALLVPQCGTFRVTFDVTNTGSNVKADEVTFLWGSFSSADAPRLELLAYGRTGDLAPGAKAKVVLTARARSLAVVVPAGRAGWTWQPGVFNIWVGGRQPTVAEVAAKGGGGTLLTTSVTLAGPETPFKKCY